MKKFAFLAATLLAFTTLSPAQSTAVPGFISYQGRVVDAAGNNVGAGTPVNRTVIFRIWDNPSSTNTANLIYSEAQTVTVSEGEFSVLVGQGVANLTQTFGYNETAKKLADLATAFNGSIRYLGVTVAATGTIATTDNEITPRQQIVSTAFAMRSKVAETVITNAIGTGNISNSSITLAKMATASVNSSSIVDGTVALGDLAANSVNSSKIVDGSIVNADISTGAAIVDTKLATISTAGKVADTALSANVALLNRSPQNFTGAINSFNGSVGIGASAPLASLHANSSFHLTALIDGSSIAGTWLGLRNTSAGGKTWQLISSGSGNGEGPGKLMFVAGSSPSVGSVNLMTLLPTGIVGIGTDSPTQAKLVVNGTTNARPHADNYGYLAPQGAFGNSASFSQNNSIYTTGAIWSGSFVISSSDERIKTIQGRSDGKADLNTLLGVEITDYHYKDVIGKGKVSQKKVIAQQVEEIFPQAVSQQTDVVPDIYKVAPIQDGWVALETDFKVGERVKLIADETEGIHEVLEVAEGKFRTAFNPEGDKVFVYGREVKDFRTVDYEAIAMLNVSATQELARQLEQQKAENAELKARLAEQARDLAALKVKDEARDTKLAAIEKLLQGADQPALRTVSLKTAE